MISPLAYIHPEAKIGENVEIAPFVYIDRNVVIGDNNKIMANANILYGSRIGNGNTIFPGAVIGAMRRELHGHLPSAGCYCLQWFCLWQLYPG